MVKGFLMNSVHPGIGREDPTTEILRSFFIVPFGAKYIEILDYSF